MCVKISLLKMQPWGVFQVNVATKVFFMILLGCFINEIVYKKYLFSLSWKTICKIGLHVYTNSKNRTPVQGCWKQHWTMFCCQHCTMLSTILFSIVISDLSLNNAKKYCWQHWTMLAAKHFSMLFSTALNRLCDFGCVVVYMWVGSNSSFCKNGFLLFTHSIYPFNFRMLFAGSSYGFICNNVIIFLIYFL